VVFVFCDTIDGDATARSVEARSRGVFFDEADEDGRVQACGPRGNAAARRGVPVFNAPFSNTPSVAELVLAEIIMLMRGIPQKNALLHRGGCLRLLFPLLFVAQYELG